MSFVETAAERGIIPQAHSSVAHSHLVGFKNMVKHLIDNKQLPENGLSEAEIRHLLTELALSDSNNFPGKVGAGEREGRVKSRLVQDRHFNLTHGIGRSGNIRDPQPKAAGSSIICQVTDGLALDATRAAGIKGLKSALVLPMATGMALRECFIALLHERPKAKHVIWPRIDQKSCLKSMLSLNLTVHPIEPLLQNFELVSNLEAIENKIRELGDENILCIHSTISCFAPRRPDKIADIGKIAFRRDIPHIVNGAYFLTIKKARNLVQECAKSKNGNSRIDAVVCSTDKNFLTPVGGSIVFSASKGEDSLTTKIAKNYPGRASMSPVLDLFITLLEIGKSGYLRLIKDQEDNFDFLVSELEKFGSERRMKVLGYNGVSVAISLERFSSAGKGDNKHLVELGSRLFRRNISGPRVVPCDGKNEKKISCHNFKNYGSSYDAYPQPYLALASAIGMERREIEILLKKLADVFDAAIRDF